MNDQFPHLFEPGSIGPVRLRNRIVMPAMGTALFDQGGRVSRRQIDYYVERAKGGAGLIITEATHVSDRLEPVGPMTMCHTDSMIVPLSDWADAVHDTGAKIFMQLTAGFGRQAGVVDPTHPPIAPSAVPAFGNPAVLCRPLTIGEIQGLVEDYGKAARRAMLAGFDGIEIHGHTGYLIDQFLSTSWNQRTDEYGGDLQGRLRFPIEIIESARQSTAPTFPIVFRLSIEHQIEGGRCLADTLDIGWRLQEAGADALNVDAGCYDAMDLIFPPTYLGDSPFTGLAEAIKKTVSVPVMVAGNITPEDGERIIAGGKADFIDSGRGLIADPDWPDKLRLGHPEDIRPCIRCNEGCVGRLLQARTISCAVNIRTGMERIYTLDKTYMPKRVLVIGGGPAGLEAARVAAIRGHKVTVMDKADGLGGMLRAAATPDFKEQLRAMIPYWERQLKKLDVDIKLKTEATPDMLDKVKADAVIVATGSRPLRPPIPGIDGENVVEVVDWHLGEKKVGQNVVMAGGGLSAADAALEMAKQGKNVTIVEMLPDIAVGMNFPSRVGLFRQLGIWGVKVLTQHKILEFVPDGVRTQLPDGKEEFVPSDTTVLALGVRPQADLVDEVKKRWADVYVVGDAEEIGNVYHAVRDGFNAGRLV